MSKVMYLLPIYNNGQMSEPANYDWETALTKPLSAAQLKAEADYREATYELQYRALKAAMDVSPKEIATLAKLHKADLSAAVRDAIETSNRPDTIPSDLSIVHRTFSNHTFHTKYPTPVSQTLKMHSDTIVGMADATAWRKGQHQIGTHKPKPDCACRFCAGLPSYSIPQRPKTSSELEVEAWLAKDRAIVPMKKSSRLARMMAKHWDKGDGHKWTQPIDPRNQELRAGVA